eukprot:380440_1
MNRISHIVHQLDPKYESKNLRTSYVSSFTPASDDDIVIVSGIRTAIGKAKRGSFKDTHPTNLLAPCLKYVIKDLPQKGAEVDDICLGMVAPAQATGRQAQFIAGIPRTTTMRTINRQCSSGLQSIADIASSINSGYIEIGIAAGLESMTELNRAKGGKKNYTITDEIKMNMDALHCLVPMGITSENVAEEYGISRKQQDEMGYLSQKRAYDATYGSEKRFSKEILPITTEWKDPKTGKMKIIIVDKDDGIRPGTSMEGLSKLRPAFKKGGTTTAGNSSQVSDGAAAVLMMKRSKANELGYKIMGRFTAFAVSGVRPEVMGIGPAFAIPKVLQQVGLKIDDIDLFEINESFASQATM